MKREEHPVAKHFGLERTRPVDVTTAESTSELLRRMRDISFTGRTLGTAADVMEAMLRDPDCAVVLTLTGAMTMGGLGRLIRLSVQRGWAQCIISTGALVGHGMIEDMGMVHYKADPTISDEEYLKFRADRVYDTLETEQNLDDMELMVRDLFSNLAEERAGGPVGSHELLAYFGEHLPGEGILQDAVKANVPVFIPAFTDSELALDMSCHHVLARREGQPALQYDGFRDLETYRSFCLDVIQSGRKLGIFTIGGGAPRNWAQQVGPYVDVLNNRTGQNLPVPRFSYGVRICPDPPHFGHLSGCTYSEGVSWGKFMPVSEGGRYAEVLMDATVGWPLLARAMLDRGL